MTTTDEPRRPDPEALLAAANKARRGRLKVFLGMAPGVGKTYEMLRTARRRKAEGDDVVIGVVESHGRRETEALLRGLEVLPRKPIEYKARTLMEFDIDGALARRPKLLIVDEYAHSNAPGSRHPKRWQDVEELLGAGIDIWTTLNVQHLESLVDVVLRITGVRQRETVPDSALSRADDIELVDITPDELRTRLADGKVYVPETARLAADNFFKPENLTALRELALRRMAQTVDDQLIATMREKGVEGPWAAGERIVVLVGGDTMANALVRTARRLSDMMMDAPWTVAHVERPNQRPPSPTAQGRLSEALKLAEQLGGSTVVLTGDDVVASVMAYARRNNVTQIVIGKSRDSRLRELLGRTLATALLRQARGAAVHVVTERGDDDGKVPLVDLPPFSLAGWHGHAGALILVAVTCGLAGLLDQFASGANLAMIFLLSVLGAGLAFGLWPAVTAAAAAALAYNFFFLEPRLSFVIGHPTDVLTFAVFFVVAMTTGWLTGRVRDQSLRTSARASAIASLLASSRRLSGSATRDDTAHALADQISAAGNAKAIVLLPQGEEIVPVAGAPVLEDLGAAPMAAARWAWEKGEAAGSGTGTLPQSSWTFWPLQGVRNRVGVAGVEANALTPGSDEEKLVLALLDQGAVALERADLALAAVEAETLRRSDRFRAALLNSISHDLRTPLSTVLGSTTTMIEYGEGMPPATRADLLQSVREEAERLNRYVGNLLDMTRLEGGGLNIREDWIDVRDVLMGAAERVSRRLGGRHIERDFPPDLPPVRLDPNLLEQAVVNILENAIAYSPDDTAIDLAAYEDRNNVVISIEDEGKGIPTAELERVFEKFRRMEEPTDRTKGAGLGLSISKGFIEAMGGRIAAASPIHGDHGTRVLISLPKSPQRPEITA
ncbi:sensor histidine kinase KdpD [Phenylobacterium sp.]|jgi:two-component system sensor histidine kinase KdpD|uniref:sensor histidine kinase KdpD n=1 Tax=Phenylobacterium sp. TaxID=1871053 RepID=UPI002E305F17|nr:sensor histidine kinase KdpD [Phenylobacterium sp.]HEX3363894.1 sensor histidine kinase KdpD [Phenylobacterium sp.]